MKENRDRSAERQGRIGSADVGAILPDVEHPYRSPLAVWQVITGSYEGDDLSGSLHVRIGCELEQMGLDAYHEETGRWPEPIGTLSCPALPYLSATPDGYDPEAKTITEVKTTFASWPEPPGYHWAQVRWQGSILETNDRPVDTLCIIVIRLGGFAPVIEYHRRPFDRELAYSEFVYLVDWWAAHVETGTAPPATGESVRDGAAERQYPAGDKAEMIAATTEADVEALAVYSKWRERREFAELQEREAKAQLMTRIGEARGIEAPGVGRVTWSARKASARIDYKAITKALEPPEDLVERHTRISAGGRTFRWTKAKQEASK